MLVGLRDRLEEKTPRKRIRGPDFIQDDFKGVYPADQEGGEKRERNPPFGVKIFQERSEKQGANR